MGGGGFISTMNTILKSNRAMLHTKDKRAERKNRYYKIRKGKPLKIHQLSEEERQVVLKNKERIKTETRWRIITTFILLIVLFFTIFLAITTVDAYQ